MPQPTRGDVHVNAPLTNLSIAYMQSQDMFVSNNVFPNIPVSKQSDLYYIYDREFWFRSEAQERAPSTPSAGGGYGLSTDSYSASVIAIHKDIDDQIRANADAVLNMDRDAMEYVTQQMLLKRDIDWATNYFVTGLWTNDYDGVAAAPGVNEFLQWDQSGSTPIEDIRAEVINVARATGRRPNVLVLGADVWSVLQDHADFLERIKYTQRGIVTTDLLAAVLGLDRVVVAWGVQNTANENATGSYDFIFGKNALLVHSASSPSILTPSAGYTFSWNGYLGAGPQGNRIKRFRMDDLNSDRIEGEMAYDQKLVAADLGAFFEDAVA